MIWKEMKRSYLVISICAALLGLLLLLLPGPTLATAGICTGVCFIVYGVTKLFEVTRFRNHFANYWLQCVLAVLPIVFGVIFLFNRWPQPPYFRLSSASFWPSMELWALRPL